MGRFLVLCCGTCAESGTSCFASVATTDLEKTWQNCSSTCILDDGNSTYSEQKWTVLEIVPGKRINQAWSRFNDLFKETRRILVSPVSAILVSPVSPVARKLCLKDANF